MQLLALLGERAHRLLPAQYVKPYLKRQKNDAADAEAICEAVTRPTMRFVPVKTPEQQSVMMLHRGSVDAQPPEGSLELPNQRALVLICSHQPWSGLRKSNPAPEPGCQS